MTPPTTFINANIFTQPREIMMQKRGIVIVVLALLLLLVIPTLTTAEIGGCYVYPQGREDLYCIPNTLDTEAQADCNTHQSCSLSQYFIPGSNCQAIPECQQVTCNVDCQSHAQGICQQLGGQAVPQDQYDLYCTPGCCKVSNLFCQYNLNRYQCEQRAQQLGVDTVSALYTYANPVGMNLQQCNRDYCQTELQTAKLNGIIFSAPDVPVEGVTISIESRNQQTVSVGTGFYEFRELAAGSVLVRVQKTGYQPASRTISLLSGTTITQDFTLTAVGAAIQLTGGVTSNDRGVSGATISWQGPTAGQVFTDGAGNYIIPDLPPGQYRFTASKVGYTSQEQSLALVPENPPVNFVLAAASLSGVRGLTKVDFSGDGTGQPTFGVLLYANGIFKGYSQYPEGNYQIDLPLGQYTLTATYQNYHLEKVITIGESQATQDLLLTRYMGECTPPNPLKDVDSFTASPAAGEKEVLLQWLKPCPEVIGYTIEKKINGVVVDTDFASPAQNSFPDIEVEWGQTYTYSIRASYGQGTSANAVEATITLGSKDCEGRYDEVTGWETFCRIGDGATRKTVWTCNAQNIAVPSLNCADRDGAGEDYYCAQLGSGNAECKDAGVCRRSGTPFGLYYTKDLCYGSSDAVNAPNYCYYDYSNSVVNQCQSCAFVQSCFDYLSQDACTINNCLDQACQWINGAENQEPLIDYGLIHLPASITPETGRGYCVQEKYDDDDQCSRCSSTANLFENYYCSAQVCSGLGRCFADSRLSTCTSCGEAPSTDANCYTYNTELECTAQSQIQKTPYGDISLSEDRCGWGRCLWKGAADSFGAGGCVKDSDADSNDDCTIFTSGGELRACRIDNSPPRTKLVPEGVSIVSLAHPEITFEGDDNYHAQGSQHNKMGLVSYCVTSADPEAPAICTEFKTAAYPGAAAHELATINLIESPYLQENINGKTYRIRFYSQDKYKNQESVQEAFIFIDNAPPEFEINEEIATVGDRTSLTAYLVGTSEPMGCSFSLQAVLPSGELQTQIIGREVQKKEITFSNLPGILYNLTATCTDSQDNVNYKSKMYIFDLEERIEIVQPALQSAVAGSSLQFKINTVSGAHCELYKSFTNEKVADFVSDEDGKMHQTDTIPGFTEREYGGEYKAVCRELLTEEVYEDYFHFTIDFTPPVTHIILREAGREERPLQFGWEKSFIREARADFECVADGFACDTTFYCLGDGCESVANPNYREYASTITITNSTQICYYSTDRAANPVYAPLCGMVLIEGYGIVLEKPAQHYYHDEQWGVSNTPSFDLIFFTKVPTQECRFDFVPGFNYNSVPAFKVLDPDAQGRYVIEKFPTTVGVPEYTRNGEVKPIYIVCTDTAGQLGPEQKINLEYDPSVPEIVRAAARPDMVIESNSVDLLVDTDDKSICKYSDRGHTEYALMNRVFPGGEAELNPASKEPRILQENHQMSFLINSFIGLKKEFDFTTQCRNGARDLSEVKNIKFTVDYTQLGGLLSFSPRDEFSSATEINLAVETTKNAVCSYRLNTSTLPMAGAGSRVHSSSQSGLAERYHKFPFSCQMGGHTVEEAFTFTIDRTNPVITGINDGEYSCGKNISVLVYTNEPKLAVYMYELYDAGAAANLSAVATTGTSANGSSRRTSLFSYFSFNQSTSFTPRGTKIAEGTLPAEMPLQLPALNLSEGHKYYVKVKAQDAAGNIGTFSDSDGVLAVPANYSFCTEDKTAPEIQFTSANESCTSLLMELHCADQVGCGKIMYGTQVSKALCNSSLLYTGAKINFPANAWLCYTAQDILGNNISGYREVNLADADGDGILDTCDACAGTLPGKVTNAQGCAQGEITDEEETADSDGDGLPDSWEKLFDRENCPLNYAAIDSNDNAIADGQEDYDIDTLTNYEEYLGRSDPCVPDEVKKKEPTRNETKLPPLPLPEEGNLLALILLIVGLLLAFGGTGYLIYYYKYMTAAGGKKAAPAAERKSFEPPGEAEEKQTVADFWSGRLFQRRKEKVKTKQREEVFGKFGRESSTIPHLTDVIKAKPSLPKLQQLAERYVEHKEDIQPGLRKEEKSIFAKLEGIAKQTKEKKITDVADTKDAESIFEKLKEINRKRKEKA